MRLRPDSARAEQGLWPLLYPYDEEAFDALEARTHREQAADSSPPDAKEALKRYTWLEHAKGRIYTDNILLNSGFLLQQWLLSTISAMEDVRLSFIAGTQKRRIASEREVLEAQEDRYLTGENIGTIFQIGRASCRERV